MAKGAVRELVALAPGGMRLTPTGWFTPHQADVDWPKPLFY